MYRCRLGIDASYTWHSAFSIPLSLLIFLFLPPFNPLLSLFLQTTPRFSFLDHLYHRFFSIFLSSFMAVLRFHPVIEPRIWRITGQTSTQRTLCVSIAVVASDRSAINRELIPRGSARSLAASALPYFCINIR